MTTLCARLRPIDIRAALAHLETTTFRDTGGTNGWIAEPTWLQAFVQGLALEGHVTYACCRKLPAGQGIPAHIDPSKPGEHRFHVPLVTHPAVTMRWPLAGEEHHLGAGYLYEVQFDQLHEIVHRAPVDRVHVQINTIDRGDA